MAKNRGAWLLAIYLFLSVFLLPMYPHGGSANELTRWATAASLVERGSFEISWTEPLIGPNVDTARVGGHLYSNKAPGTAIIAAPVYALTRFFTGPPDASNIRITWFAMRFFLSTLPLLLLAAWLFARETDELSLATLLFATPLFTYSLLFFSHVFVAVVLYLAFRYIYDQRYVMPAHCLASGALCGLAVISEFPAVFPVAVFGAGLLFTDKRERYRRVAYFVLGGLPFILTIALYNYSLFGSPLAMSYAYESFPEWAEVAGQGVFGIGWPQPYNLYLLLISPSRGLLFTAPILIFSFVLMMSSRESRTLRHRVKLAAIVLTIVAICGHGAAHGGWAFGPRYLILTVPLMLDSFFDGEVYERSNIWQGALFGFSLVLCSIPALTFPFAPPEFAFPHRDFWTRLIWDENWFVPNIANLFGVSSGPLSVLPAVAAFVMILHVLVTSSRRPGRFFGGLAAAVMVVSLVLLIPAGDDPELSFRRASIAERYFQPAGRLAPFESAALDRGDAAALERIRSTEWMIADVRAYAPDDFPYLSTRELGPSPTAVLRSAAEAQAAGDPARAEELLVAGRDRFPFARCDFGADLAVVYYSAGRRDDALAELEAIQPLAGRAASPICIRSQFLLGSLYRELGRMTEADRSFESFLANSEGTRDAELLSMRKRLGR